MKTALLQSYKTNGVPDWLHQCLASARHLARRYGWTYTFMDDALFDLIPASARSKLSGHPAMMSDLARLLFMTKVLDEDHDIERVIWLDADVYVFSIGNFLSDEKSDVTVGRQIWIQPNQTGDLKAYRQVHNAFLSVRRNAPHLEFLVWAINRMVNRLDRPVSPQTFGPKLLTALHNIVGFDVSDAVGMASPLVLRDLARGGGPALDRLVTETGPGLTALNLCSSYRNQTIDGVDCTDTLYSKAISQLCDWGSLPGS